GRHPCGSSDPISYSHYIYGAFVNLEWLVFDGFERENRVREAASQKGAAEADLAALELRVVRQVWQAYTDVKTSLGKREFALALLAASEEAYAAALESYRVAGPPTGLDLPPAARDLAGALFREIRRRAATLRAAPALVLGAGEGAGPDPPAGAGAHREDGLGDCALTSRTWTAESKPRYARAPSVARSIPSTRRNTIDESAVCPDAGALAGGRERLRHRLRVAARGGEKGRRSGCELRHVGGRGGAMAERE